MATIRIQKNNTRACELQPIPFKSPAQIGREKRAVVGIAPPYTQEQRAIAEEYFKQFWAEYPKKQGVVPAFLLNSLAYLLCMW